jgi:hypothetical protein
VRILAGVAISMSIAVAGLAACSSFGADASGPGDATPDAAPPPPPAPDVSPDGGGPVDAAPDGAPGYVPFCNRAPQMGLTFCADFDRDPFDLGWTSTDSTGTGITLDVVPVPPGGRVLHARAVAASNGAASAMYYDLAQRPELDVTLAFELALAKLQPPVAGQYVEFATLACINGPAHLPTDLSLGLAYSNGELELYQGASSIATLPSAGTPTKYVFHVTIPAPPMALGKWIQITAGDPPQMIMPPAGATPTLSTPVRLGIGVTFDAQDKSAEAFMDDVALFVAP